MRYELIEDQSDNSARLESDGTVIWQSDGGWSIRDDDYLNAILEDANFGHPQKDALRALIGLVDRAIENPRNP